MNFQPSLRDDVFDPSEIPALKGRAKFKLPLRGEHFCSKVLPLLLFISKKLSIDFTAIVPGQRINEFDPARVLVKSQARFDELLDVICNRIATLESFARDNEGFWFYQAVPIVVTDDRAFPHGFVLQQTILNLGGPDKDAAHFQHVVGAAVIPVVAFLVDMELIARRAPVAGKRLFRFLMRVPVTEKSKEKIGRAHV